MRIHDPKLHSMAHALSMSVFISKELTFIFLFTSSESNSKAMNRNWSNQKANPALKTKAGNK